MNLFQDTLVRRDIDSANRKPYGRSPSFDGKTLDVVEDYARLKRQLDRVRVLMLDGEWRTLRMIQAVAGGSDAAISARLRDLRKEKHGSYNVERQRVKGGLWEYRVNGLLPRTEKKKSKSITVERLHQIAKSEAQDLNEELLFQRFLAAAENNR